MSRPLHSGARGVQAVASHQPHWGLWFDKFCDAWRVEGEAWSLSSWTEGQGRDKKTINPRQRWCETLTKQALGEQAALTEAALRSMLLASGASGGGGASWLVRTTSRFVTGAGRPHPIENGLAFHPTLGVPCMPGSGVKGMLRAGAEALGVDGAAIEAAFGSPEGGVGALVFLDLLPVAPVQMAVDILTPHAGDWVQGRTTDAGDWHSPTPVPFLTVDVGNTFLLSVLPRPGSGWSWQEAELKALIEEVLGWLGAGAKTMAGYGRFEVIALDDPADPVALALRRARGAWELQAMTLAERLTRRIEQGTEAERLAVLDELRQGRIAGEEREAAVKALRAHADFARWRRGEKQDASINLSVEKLRERAEFLLTDDERQTVQEVTPAEEMGALLVELRAGRVELVAALREAMQQGRWPLPQLQALSREATRQTKNAKKGSEKAKLAAEFEAYVKKLK